ncbi:MAG: septum formation initiator family protein [Lentisphaerae bacterium]|nr:septum formation initiator family protein [Lentisphaerota bacterium]
MNYWVALYRFALGVLAVLALVGVVFLFLPKCSRLRALQREHMAAQEHNAALEAEIRDLQTRRERFDSEPAFVERTAREAGMLKPDETVYKFLPPQEVEAEKPRIEE